MKEEWIIILLYITNVKKFDKIIKQNNYVKQQYLPYELSGEEFYHPSMNGYEQKIADHMKKIKEEAEE